MSLEFTRVCRDLKQSCKKYFRLQWPRVFSSAWMYINSSHMNDETFATTTNETRHMLKAIKFCQLKGNESGEGKMEWEFGILWHGKKFFFLVFFVFLSIPGECSEARKRQRRKMRTFFLSLALIDIFRLYHRSTIFTKSRDRYWAAPSIEG